ncbi:MAG: YoaK family protein [Myxococcota bacterium]
MSLARITGRFKVAETAPDPRPEYAKQLTAAAGVLAAVAGYVNAITIGGALHVATTHMSGTTTHFSVDLVQNADRSTLLLDLGLIVTFVLGASVSGMVLDSTQLRLGRRYGVLLVIESLLLSLAWLALRAGSPVHLVAIAMAAGLQNSMATQYSRAIVRTTHMTGILTDLGIALGKWIARRGVTSWRVILYLSIFGGFASGGIAGAAAYFALRENALLVPIGVTGIGGLVYWALRHRWLIANGNAARQG